ncbi:MAG: high frequency lysogenization protein HflD [Oceanospirillaceae bacterium]|nr:high frequency lysogenization protein HflD [Oceanospirillaceae bacterium]MCP5334083.1 high frequency lysogenization protein HflD [Oceanospirillaceae bacterium]MCP5351281.1 high frequency lysogenization protein HflD [Oceanospirillaceae bacterium]
MNKQTQTEHQVLALAGLFQAAYLVEQVAKTGQVSEEHLRTSIESLLDQNPASVEAVYGNKLSNLRLGLQEVKFLTDGKSRTGSSPDVIRYALSLLHLEGQLRKNPQTLDAIGKGIENANRQLQHFASTHENVVANLAGLYQDTISKFRYRIHVTGTAQHLQNNQNANKIRALLLAGIRSAMLWRQVGGRRWQLMFSRRRLNRAATQLLGQMS